MRPYKTKNVCLIKNYIMTMKRQAIDWKKIFTIHISDKELASSMYKQLKTQLYILKKHSNWKLGKTC